MRRSRFVIGLNLALLALLAAGLTWLPQGEVGATHKRGIYLEAERVIDWKEVFCEEDAQSSLSFPNVRGRITGALQWETPPSGEYRWDGINYGHISLVDAYNSSGVGCNGLNFSTNPRLSDTAIRYYVQDYNNLDPACWNPPPRSSCTVHTGVTWNTSAGVGYQYANVYLYTDPMTGDDYGDPDRRRHTVNHETGHVFGLADGGPSSPYPSSGCSPLSIMHPSYYGCSARIPWPTWDDVLSVWDITNAP